MIVLLIADDVKNRPISNSFVIMYEPTQQRNQRSRKPQNQSKFTIEKMSQTMQLTERLNSREEVQPGELDLALETRARMHLAGAPYSPVYPTAGRLFPGTYYLNGIDSKFRRTYSRVPLGTAMDLKGSSLAPPIVLRLAKLDAISEPVTGKLHVIQSVESGCADRITEARRRVACVITGTSVGLPGGDEVFQNDNLDRLVRGDQCIKPVSQSLRDAMLEKKVVQLVKHPDKTVERMPVDSNKQVIKLAAQLGSLSLPKNYGVARGLADTMDVAAQVAVAAGLEALKSAGLVSGKSSDPEEWMLPEQYRDGTGVVYASSFPAMDAAVGEVMRFLRSQTVGAAESMRLISSLRDRLVKASPNNGKLSDEDEKMFASLLTRTEAMDKANGAPTYEFDRKFLFRCLVLGNAQLAQLVSV